MTWKPRSEYPKDKRPIVIARYNGDWCGPFLVVWSEFYGHFYICPGVPMFYGDHQFGMMVADTFDEWHEIPAYP
jgi:hypothetical protein